MIEIKIMLKFYTSDVFEDSRLPDLKKYDIIKVEADSFDGDVQSGSFESLCNAVRGSSAIHIDEWKEYKTGIRDEDIAAAPPADEVLTKLKEFCGDGVVIAESAHKAAVFRQYLKKYFGGQWDMNILPPS